MIEKIKIDKVVTTIANPIKPRRIILFGSMHQGNPKTLVGNYRYP